MKEFQDILTQIGLPVAEKKMIGLCTVLEYLGMLVDFLNQMVGIPKDKHDTCLELVRTLIDAHWTHGSVTVKEIKRMAGHLNFICHAIPAGRTYLSTLYSLMKPMKPGQIVKPGHWKRINKEIHDDMVMFEQFLDEMNSELNHTVPFLRKLDINQDHIQFFADSAGSYDRGFGCVFGNHWMSGFWCNTNIFNYGFCPNIALLELYAIVLAFEVWAPQLSSKTITLQSDNQATVNMINKKKASIPAAMNLLRHLTKTCMLFQIYVKASYIPGTSNQLSDLLSRGKFDQFRRVHPTADRYPAPLPVTLWPPVWSLEEMKPRDTPGHQ